MIDQHMIQRMESFRKLIAERDEKIDALIAAHSVRLSELDELSAGLTNKVNELDGEVAALLRSIGTHEAEAASCNEGFVVAAAKLKAQYDEACAELAGIRDTELARLVAAVNQDRQTVVETDARLTAARKVLETEQQRRAETEAEHDTLLRKLRGGKYGEAKKLLAELEARLAKRTVEAEAEPEAPTASVQTGTPIMCQACGKIAKPWVLSSSGASLCLDCATGKTAEKRG